MAMSAPPAPAPSSQGVIVRPCASSADCQLVASLCASSFPEECASQGLSCQQWASIEADDIQRVPEWWKQIGLACEGDKLLGVVVLTVENEADDSMSWSEYSRRVGCGPTILSMLYDRVLDEALLEHECLIDFIAVSPDARGKGVGTKLMAWAEQTGARILAETEADAVGAHGVEMTLWVAADNTVAVRLYERSGYTQVKRTDTGACRCMASRVLNWFLGHPVWIKMHKALPAPAHLATSQPQQQAIPAAVPVTACAAPPSPAAEFETIALDAPASQQRQPSPAVPSSPGGSLLRKLGLGFFGAGAQTPRASGDGAAGKPSGASASQGATPRIAAVGSGLPAGASQTARQQGGNHNSSVEEGRSIQLHAPGLQLAAEEARLARPAAGGADKVAAGGFAASAPCPPSVASASVVSMPLDSDAEDSDGEERGRAGASAGQPERFEVVELSANSLTA